MKNIDLSKIENLLTRYQQFSELSFTQLSLTEFFHQWTLIHANIEEEFAITYIDYTCYTNDEWKSKKLELITEKQEKITEISHQITQKVIETFTDIPAHLQYAFQLLKHSIQFFNPKNLPLETECSHLSQKYQQLIGALQFEKEGKKLPISMSKIFLESPEREIREEVFIKVQKAFLDIHEPINDLFHQQVQLRNTQAINTSYKNYRDFMHEAKDRFDYTPQECEQFSQSILKYLVPLSNKLRALRKEKLHLKTLEPFDLSADIDAKETLKPVKEEKDFVSSVIKVLEAVSPEVAQTLKTIESKKGLDLFSRQNKAPGGYNFPLSASKTSFIFMNCALTHDDLVTLFHETGHAFHFDCYKNQGYPFLYESPPSEVAELASMSMELLSMEHWNLIYTNPVDLKRAKFTHLERIIHFFPWMAVVDSFQHWIYLHPQASIQERNEYFKTLYIQFFPLVDWSRFQEFLPTLWQKQAHIIELPFYYVEYGIAQLGALQIWNQYKKNNAATFQNYKKALSLGSTMGIKDIYAQAEIKLDFSPSFIQEIAQFLEQEIDL